MKLYDKVHGKPYSKNGLYKEYENALDQFIEILRMSVEQEEQVRESMARMEI